MDEELRILELEGANERLDLSNQRLIAELGRIAAALGVETSMVKVLAKIEELKAARKPKVLLTSVDDWEALYIDGKCVTQDHSIELYRVLLMLSKLGVLDFDEEKSGYDADIEEHIHDVGQFPDIEVELDALIASLAAK